MKEWTTKILKMAGKKKEQAKENPTNDDREAANLGDNLNQPPMENPLPAGSRVCYFDTPSSNPECLLIEGIVQRRATKLSHAKATNYKTNYYNLTDVRVVGTIKDNVLMSVKEEAAV